MPKSNVLLPFFALLCIAAAAQTPPADSLWIEAGDLRICLQADGSLYSGAPGGAVLYRHVTPQGEEKWLKVVQDAGPWFGGLDPGGSLLMSAQKFEPRVTDFRAGFAGVPGSGKIWSVTYDQIAQHVADYSDNGYIDDPIEAIFAWPGWGNRFFEAYNGFALPESYLIAFNFFDLNHNSLYEPQKGEFPQILTGYGGDNLYSPNQFHFLAFYTDTSNLFPGFSTYPIQAAATLYTFDCPQSDVYENAFFVSLVWQNTGLERIDSNIIGLYLNTDVGNPADDYIGSGYNSFFSYNAHNLDPFFFGTRPPVLMVSAIHPPVNSYGEPSETQVMPVGPLEMPGLIQAMCFPTFPMEYYKYLTCSWRNGRPLTVGGTGYTFSSQYVPTTMAFWGNPYTPGTWTEVNAGNPAGDRRAVVSWQYDRILPGKFNAMRYMFAVHPHDGTQLSFEMFDQVFKNQIEVVNSFQGFDFIDPPLDDPRCQFRPDFSFPHLLIRPYPNPASDVLNLQIEGGEPQYIRLYDALGRLVLEQQTPCDLYCDWENPVQLPVAHLPSGLYVVEVVAAKTGERAVRKVVVH